MNDRLRERMEAVADFLEKLDYHVGLISGEGRELEMTTWNEAMKFSAKRIRAALLASSETPVAPLVTLLKPRCSWPQSDCRLVKVGAARMIEDLARQPRNEATTEHTSGTERGQDSVQAPALPLRDEQPFAFETALRNTRKQIRKEALEEAAQQVTAERVAENGPLAKFPAEQRAEAIRNHIRALAASEPGRETK